MSPRILLFFIVLCVVTPVAGLAQDSADVVVYGSTPGGFCAAIAAAREGATVILLEPTDHIGGLSTGGLSHCDSNQMVRETLMGLFDEWHKRVVKDYTDRGLKAPYDPTLKDTARWTFEPHVAMRVTHAMLKEAGVKVLTGRYLKSVTKEGTRITSIVTSNGTFSARVFVDGSYEGDLMAAAGVDWTTGRESRAEFGESYAGKKYPKAKMNISGFDDAGKLLPLVTTSDAGPDDAGDKNIMTYSFRLCLTRDPQKLVPMPKPANYDPARFELARRALKVGAKVGFDLYPLPGGKLDGNNSIGGQISLGLVGGCNTWHSADEAGRKKIWEEHKQYTLEFIHFLRTDSAVPKRVRDEFADLGLCKDEFAATGHFPPALYVRESRRMKGMHVLSQKDIIHSPQKDDPIAISSFPIDSHDCQRVALKDGGVINEGTIFPVRFPGTRVGYAYHVPYRSVLPKAAQCTNLLVPVALSCTHVAISSLRIEGAWMVIGQGAGVAAALAAKKDVAVQELPYPLLRERLLAQKQVLKLPETTKKAAATRPNILFIAIDDQNDWIGHLGGHPLVKTPHIDRLAARGTTFLNAHCQAPLCNPSRASLLLSLRPTTTGIYGLAPLPRTLPLLRDRVSLPQHFAAQGYTTAATGKIYHGGTGAGEAGGAKSKEHSAAAGAKSAPQIEPEFQVTAPFGGVGARPAKKLIPPTPLGNNPLVDWGVWPLDNDDAKKGDYQVATWVAQQIKAAPKDRPFFIAAGFALPHVPCYATQKWFDLYPDDDSVLPKVLDTDRDDAPRFSWYLHWKQSAPRLKWVQENNQWRNLVRSYLACTSLMDAQVGRVLTALEESGHAENTIVVLWSDHGWHLGEKGITGKCSLWERSTRVPLIFAGPGVKAGQRCTLPAELLDVYPTLIELAGAPKRDDLEGISLLPQLRDAAALRERPAITSHNQGNHAIRSERWRYIRYADGSEEFYDMQADPHEWHNLAAKPEHAAVIAQHKQWLPRIDVPPASGSAQRILTYDKTTDEAVWDGVPVKRSDPIP